MTVNDKLVGLAWGMEHQSGNWMGLQLKANYKFKGLSRFLHHERSKLFADKKLFTLGTGAQDEGIIQFKRELGRRNTGPDQPDSANIFQTRPKHKILSGSRYIVAIRTRTNSAMQWVNRNYFHFAI